MAQYRQSGARDYDLHHHYSNGGPDHISLPVRPSPQPHKAARHRRLARFDKGRRVSIGAVAVLISLGFFVTVLAYCYLSRDSNGTDVNDSPIQEDDLKSDLDFLTNVTRTEPSKVLGFGKGSVAHGRDSRYWDKDDRRRDDDYDEDAVEHYKVSSGSESASKGQPSLKVLKDGNKSSSLNESSRHVDQKGVGLYNEAGRNELKMYEAEYEASLKSSDIPNKETSKGNQLDGEGFGTSSEAIDTDDDYDSTDSSDPQTGEPDDDDNEKLSSENGRESSEVFEVPIKVRIAEETKKASKELIEVDTFNSRSSDYIKKTTVGQATKKSKADTKRKSKRRSCEMKVLNSTAQLVEPLETRKFSRFSLQYVEDEEKPDGQLEWEPRFAGHQSLRERELSFLARDQKINCGFVKGPQGYPSTGFDLPEDDLNYMSSCHIAVVSCIFGNSDRLRTPANKMITRLSRKNVCFIMFVDDVTMRTLNSEGNMPDPMGFIGLWKIVVVKNLPYDDMRRVGKVPKFLSHRLFPSARYSIWLDSKLRLQLDPLLILEYFLWRKGHEYSISNHYDRHCVWEEVAQNKRLNKYNHTAIDEQFKFYQSDGLKRFNPSDPEKLLPSNVPEGSFIVRAHTPMSNLFSCLWFNEVDRFTSRDQLSFAYTYQKLRKMNPTKPFHLNMFKDCERRRVAKLFRHRSQEKRNTYQQATE